MKLKKVAEIELKHNYQKRLLSKGVEYKKIDITRVPHLYRKYSHLFALPKLVHTIGTNGKGSSGRFLTSMLQSKGIRVFHFTSPHIFRFNERFFLDGGECSDELLEEADEFLSLEFDSVDLDSLSYFEYSFFLALYISQRADIALFEAGLGGEFDATSVLEYELCMVTPISLDHKEFLGDSLEKIASTKLRAIRSMVVFAPQKDIVKEVAEKLGLEYITYRDVLSKKELDMIKASAEGRFEEFIASNLLLSASAFKKLGYEIEPKHIPLNLELKGRCQKVAENLVVDVGHNVAAAEILAKTFMNKKYNLVYNSLEDKEYQEILKVFRKMTTKLYIIPIDSPRAVKINLLKDVATKLRYEVVKNPDFKSQNWLVFGSFYTVEAFLKRVDEG
ncbi:MAG: bifunctional folylpolyglutamate synthase/dihydrofolate synthase [Campylobacterales bacterium]